MQKPQNTNNKLSLVDRVICRTPVFTLNDECITKFEELKVLIKDASPEFHKLVGSLNLNDVNKTKKLFTPSGNTLIEQNTERHRLEGLLVLLY